nr:alpha/beta hydrolase family protein [Nocardioides luti]
MHVVKATRTSRREWHLVVATKQLERPVRVTILLPVGYGRTHRRYPSLYLFHGTSGGANDWVDMGRARQTSRAFPFVVVMPDMGYDSNGGSFFTNWVDQETVLGTANWETFHINQLVPWIDANLRTVRGRWGRAIAGLSQGGFGSFSYAARHPDLFVSAASFSGAPDIFEDPRARSIGTGIVSVIATTLDGVPADAMFGDPATRELNWKGHNPASIVTNLADTDLALWCGNGATGPYDEPSPTTPAGSGIEGLVHESTGYFVQAADAAHVAYTYDDYGPGTHSWPYWARDLEQYLPQLRKVVREHRTRPASVSYRSVDKHWRQWGYRVRNHRSAAQDWSMLDDATRSRFTLVAANPATVRTPRAYRPGRTYTVSYRGGHGPHRVVAGHRGRLTLKVVPGAAGTVAVSVAR